MLHRLPYDVLLRVVHMLCARAPHTDMTAAALSLAQVSPYLRQLVSHALSHSLTLRFESDAATWAHVLRPSLRTLELLTFGSPRHVTVFRQLLRAPRLTHVRMPLSPPLLLAVSDAPCVQSLFVTSFSTAASDLFLRTVASLKRLRALRIDSRTAHLNDMHDGVTTTAVRNAWQFRLLQRLANTVPCLESLDIFVDDLTSRELVLALNAFSNLRHLVLRTTCSMYLLPLLLQPILLTLDTVALHGFRHVPCLDVLLSRAAVTLSNRLVAASYLSLDANLEYRAMRQFDTVVVRNEPLNLPKSLTRLTLLWHDSFVPKMRMHTLPASLCTAICSLQSLKHLVLVHVLISSEHLQQLLSSLASQLHTLSVPVSMQGCVPSKRLLQLFQLCAQYCTELRELQVSELRCRNFSSCGPAASASALQMWSCGGATEGEDVQRLEQGLQRLCRRAPYLDERPMRSVIRTMIADQLIFCHSAYAL